jgi:penicillin G amidase
MVHLRRPVDIRHSPEGFPRASAVSWEDAWYGLGWLHGVDRGGQVCLARIVAQGRVCELLRDDAEALAVDLYFRRLGLAGDARLHIGRLPPESAVLLRSYCQGLTDALQVHPPWPLRLAGYRPEPFLPADALAVLKLVSFTGLTEGQRLVEIFLVELARRGADRSQIQELFPNVDAVDVELLRELRSVPSLFPPEALSAGCQGAAGSNAWVVAGARTASGAPLLCNDPHLQINRLPAVLYEVRIEARAEWLQGATVPGMPGFLTGRTARLAWGVTYSFADTADLFVERCREGRFLRNGAWMAFRTRKESIARKHHPPNEVLVHENDHGVLEGDPADAGDYLCLAWSGFGDAGVGTLAVLMRLPHCRTVSEARNVAAGIDLPSLHIVLADRTGGIGYQMVGRIPRRRPDWSGLSPVPGWDGDNDWRGWLDPHRDLPWEENPPRGFIASANEARSRPDGVGLATMAQPPYRLGRIERMLDAEHLSVRYMQQMQYDVYSLQAERLLPVLLPHVPQGPERSLLEAWDLRYTPDSTAATLFEDVREAVVEDILGGVVGRDWVRRVLAESILPFFLLGPLDDMICREDSRWLAAGRRGEVLGRAVRRALKQRVEPWGERNVLRLPNLFVGGRLGWLLGFERGPFPLPGSRATLRQGSRGRYFGMDLVSGASYRFIADLGSDRSWSNFPGGASESRFSRWYAADLPRWLDGRYKEL